MTTQTLNSFLPNLSNFFKSIYDAIIESKMRSAHQHIKKEMMKRKLYRETHNELSKLTEKELNDIGLTRGEIHSVAMEAYLDNR